jgi:chemotaxis protein histidine kinase CheA
LTCSSSLPQVKRLEAKVAAKSAADAAAKAAADAAAKAAADAAAKTAADAAAKAAAEAAAKAAADAAAKAAADAAAKAAAAKAAAAKAAAADASKTKPATKTAAASKTKAPSPTTAKAAAAAMQQDDETSDDDDNTADNSSPEQMIGKAVVSNNGASTRVYPDWRQLAQPSAAVKGGFDVQPIGGFEEEDSAASQLQYVFLWPDKVWIKNHKGVLQERRGVFFGVWSTPRYANKCFVLDRESSFNGVEAADLKAKPKVLFRATSNGASSVRRKAPAGFEPTVSGAHVAFSTRSSRCVTGSLAVSGLLPQAALDELADMPEWISLKVMSQALTKHGLTMLKTPIFRDAAGRVVRDKPALLAWLLDQPTGTFLCSNPDDTHVIFADCATRVFYDPATQRRDGVICAERLTVDALAEAGFTGITEARQLMTMQEVSARDAAAKRAAASDCEPDAKRIKT